MSSNKKIIFLVLMLLALPFAMADFELYTESSPSEICPGSTGLFTDIIQNTGMDSLSFTISTSGTASAFSTAVPMGFTLYPEQIRTIFTYISPYSSTNIGTYSLDMIATTDGDSKELNHNVIVKDCYEYFIEALDQEKHTCPCESDKFDFELTNNGQFTESYTLSVEGEYSSSVVLSTDQVTLNSGESEIIYAYVTTSCSDLGDYDFTLKVTPYNSNSIRTATSTMIVDPCYNFDIQTERDLLNICEHTLETVPITIENSGSTSNKFELELNGPLWANLDRNTLTIAPNSVGVVNLVINPDYGVEGSFEMEFSATPERGEIKAYNIFDVNIKQCHGVSVDIEKSLDKICNSLENTYNVNVRNVGEYSKEYYFNVDGPDWATLDKTSATLEVGEETQLTLTINPLYDVSEASYIITVEATAKDSNKIANSDVIEVETVTKDQCYQAFVGIEEKSINVYYDSSATMPVVIENKGTYTTTYDLSVTGTASSFTYLNPSSVTIDAGKSEVVYLYVAPSGQITNGDYSVTVSARLGDSSILASEKVDIIVSESAYLAPDVEVEVVKDNGSLLDRVLDFFASFFKSETTEEVIEEQLDEFDEVVEELEEVEGEIEETIEEEVEEEIIVEELLNETEEEIELVNETGEVVEEEITDEQLEDVAELTAVETFLLQGDIEYFLLNGEEHSIELTTLEDDSIWITISSDPISINLEPGDIKEIDIDEDGINDLKVGFVGYSEDGEAQIVYETLSEVVEDETLEVITAEVISEEESSNFFASFFTSLATIWGTILAYKYHILGTILVILILYGVFKTGSHKKIVEFFEEEIEEEEVPILDKKEEKKTEEKPKKEEKPNKEEKKTEKKTTKKKEEEKKPAKKKELNEDTEDELEIKGLDEESDKEDFIIEFDDEEEKK